MKGKKAIFVADDREVNRNGLQRLIESVPNFEYVGGAGTVNQVIEQVCSLTPDVLLLDMKWGASQRAGEKILLKLREQRIPTKTVLYSSNPALLVEQERLRGLADAVAISPYSRDELISIVDALFPAQVVVSSGSEVSIRVAILLLSGLAAILALVTGTYLVLGAPAAENALIWALILFLVVSTMLFFAVKMIEWKDVLALLKAIVGRKF